MEYSPTKEDAVQDSDAIQNCSPTDCHPCHTMIPVNYQCAPLFLLSECHPYMEPVAAYHSLSIKLGDLQGPAATKHHVHVDPTDTFNL